MSDCPIGDAWQSVVGSSDYARGWRDAMKAAHHAHADETYLGFMSANGVLGAGPDAVIVDGDWLASLLEMVEENDATLGDVKRWRGEDGGLA